MSSFINRYHNQTLVYWAFSGRDGFGGATFDAPTEISGRWEIRQKMLTDRTGQRLEKGTLAYVGQDISENDWLFLGALTDIASSVDETNPKNVTGALEVKSVTKIPTLKADKFQRIAFLSSATSTR
jgi:hypothetical protein|tara:strand:- start:756 stop:1133 length:378 start_codon:yes stop_codon:yes gene_type:complete